MVLSILELLGGLNYAVLWQLSACSVQNKILNFTGYALTTAAWFESQLLHGLVTESTPNVLCP